MGLAVRPSKIVAGHEPEKTNEFLQQLGKVCLKKIDTSSSVQKTLAGEKPGKKRESKDAKGKSSDEGGDAKRDKRGKEDKERKPRESSGSSRQKEDSKERKPSSKDREGS